MCVTLSVVVHFSFFSLLFSILPKASLMSIKLRLLLFYLNNIAKDNLDTPPEVIRKANKKKQDTFFTLLEYPPEEVASVDDRVITVRDGAEIRVRRYRPSNAENLPLIIYYHGGGFVLRSIESHDRVCRRLCRNNNAVVISVDYRLAPENKFPIPHQDCYDAAIWAVDNASDLGINPDEVTVAGDSAGANLASVVSILARDNDGPKIKNQVLIYPCCDSSKRYESEEKFAKGYFLSTERMDWFTNHYVNTREEVFDPLVSPVLTEDLSNLPRTFLFTAEYDPLKGEGIAFADKMKAAGNDVMHKDYAQVIHGFINMPKISKECLVAHDDIREFLGYH